MEKITKENVEKFCEDNHLDEGLADLMDEVAKMDDAKAEVVPKGDDMQELKGTLKIEIDLEEM